jgi:ferredoxin
VCVPECPVGAIFAEEDLPEDQRKFIAINAELSQAWPTITRKKEPLPDAVDWDGKPNKLDLLDRG